MNELSILIGYRPWTKVWALKVRAGEFWDSGRLIKVVAPLSTSTHSVSLIFRDPLTCTTALLDTQTCCSRRVCPLLEKSISAKACRSFAVLYHGCHTRDLRYLPLRSILRISCPGLASHPNQERRQRCHFDLLKPPRASHRHSTNESAVPA